MTEVFGASAISTIQTPLLALAWEQVAAASTDEPAFAAEGLPQLRLHYDWLARERDVDGDGLLTIINPDESGLDDSPKYDRVSGWMRHDSPGYWWLVERYRRLGYDARAIAERYEEHTAAFRSGFALWRSWRGPSWMDTAWLLVPAMRDLGYGDDADRIVESLEVAADRHGFREYYNPLTGAGIGARHFGFATLLIDLLAESGIEAVKPSAERRMMQP